MEEFFKMISLETKREEALRAMEFLAEHSLKLEVVDGGVAAYGFHLNPDEAIKITFLVAKHHAFDQEKASTGSRNN